MVADGGEVSPRSKPAVSIAVPDDHNEQEVLVPSPNKQGPSSLPSGSSRRWSAVLGLGKLGRKRGSVSSNVDEEGNDENDSRNVTPASSTIDGDDDAEEDTPRGRALLKEPEKTKNPMRRLTLTRSSSSSSSVPTLTTEPQSLDLDRQASQLIMQAFDRGSTPNASSTSLNLAPSNSSTPPNSNKRSSTSSALAALGLRAAAVGGSTFGSAPPTGSNPSSPTNDAPIHQTKSTFLQKSKPVGAKAKRSDDERESRDRLANRAPSPFFRARRSRSKQRARERSPEVGALEKDRDTGPESDGESVVASSRSQTGVPIKFRPQASAYETDATEDEAMTDDSGDEDDKDDDDYDGLDEDGLEIFDDETEANTVANAVFFEGDAGGLGGMAPGEEYVLDDVADPEKQAAAGDATDKRDDINAFGEEIEVDPLGEGPNVIVPPEPLFATPSARNQSKRKTMKSGLELVTSRPTFARDRCTITLTHGEPDEALEESGKRLRRYVVLSDISEESTYAVEWAIGTVARDGDEVFLVTVKEDESKGVVGNESD